MSSNSQRPALIIHELTSTNATTEKLEQLLSLSRSIFNPSEPNDDYKTHAHDRLSGWQQNISHPHSIILYATTRTSPNEPLGLFFATPRTQTELGRELLHLWIAAVQPASRGLGIFPLLMERLMEHAKAMGYGEMTVCTYPKRVGKMYRILGKNGWELVCEYEEIGKVLMKIDV